MNFNNHITSDRLRFGTWSRDMRPLAVKLWGNSQVSQYINKEGKFSKEEIGQKLETEIMNLEIYTVQYWPLFTLNNEFIGCCGLRPRNTPAKIYEIGCHLLPEFWGQGYAVDAMKPVIRYAKNQGFNKLFAGHNPNNIASQKMLIKLGFIFIGTEFYPPTNLYHPAYELNLL